MNKQKQLKIIFWILGILSVATGLYTVIAGKERFFEQGIMPITLGVCMLGAALGILDIGQNKSEDE